MSASPSSRCSVRGAGIQPAAPHAACRTDKRAGSHRTAPLSQLLLQARTWPASQVLAARVAALCFAGPAGAGTAMPTGLGRPSPAAARAAGALHPPPPLLPRLRHCRRRCLAWLPAAAGSPAAAARGCWVRRPGTPAGAGAAGSRWCKERRQGCNMGGRQAQPARWEVTTQRPSHASGSRLHGQASSCRGPGLLQAGEQARPGCGGAPDGRERASAAAAVLRSGRRYVLPAGDAAERGRGRTIHVECVRATAGAAVVLRRFHGPSQSDSRPCRQLLASWRGGTANAGSCKLWAGLQPTIGRSIVWLIHRQARSAQQEQQ